MVEEMLQKLERVKKNHMNVRKFKKHRKTERKKERSHILNQPNLLRLKYILREISGK